jgi:hypothetical protein
MQAVSVLLAATLPVSVAGRSPSLKRQVPVLSSRPSVLYENTSDIWPWQVYQTEQTLNPPQLDITWNGQALEPGVIFLTPRNFNGSNATKAVAPMLLTSQGDLVWEGPQLDPAGPYEFDNFRLQAVNGTEYLTYWTGYNQQNVNSSHGYGNITFLDQNYNVKFSVCPQLDLTVLPGTPHDCDADMQEAYVTPWGTLLVTAYNVTQVDLSSVNGSADGYVLDSQVHEIDMATSESIWKWSALDHIPLNASQLPIPANTTAEPWDYVHINSAAAYGENILINARHTWSVYAVNRTGGDIIWDFNGETGGDWGTVPMEASFVSFVNPY